MLSLKIHYGKHVVPILAMEDYTLEAYFLHI